MTANRAGSGNHGSIQRSRADTAVQFGRQGASLTLAARNETSLQETAREVERLGGEAHVVVTDVANWEQINRWLGGTWLTMSTLESLTRDLHPGTDLAILLGDQ